MHASIIEHYYEMNPSMNALGGETHRLILLPITPTVPQHHSPETLIATAKPSDLIQYYGYRTTDMSSTANALVVGSSWTIVTFCKPLNLSSKTAWIIEAVTTSRTVGVNVKVALATS